MPRRLGNNEGDKINDMDIFRAQAMLADKTPSTPDLLFLVVETGSIKNKERINQSFTVHITAAGCTALYEAQSSEADFDLWLKDQEIPPIHYKDGADQGSTGPAFLKRKGGSAKQLTTYYSGLLQLFLRDTIRHGISNQLEAILQKKVFYQLIEILVEHLVEIPMPWEDINLDTILGDDLEADSLDVVSIVMAAELVFEIHDIPDGKLHEKSTVGNLVDLIVQALKV